MMGFRKKFTPSRSQKYHALEHLHASIQELLRLSRELGKNREPRGDTIELVLLKLHLLWNFFEPTTRRTDEVLATDYDFAARRVIYHSWYRRRVGRKLAHLTYGRATAEKIDWPFHKLVPPVLQRAEKFARYLLEEDLFRPSPFRDKKQRSAWAMLLEKLRRRESHRGVTRTTLP